MSRWKFCDALKYGLRARHIVEAKVAVQRVDVDLPTHRGVFQNRFDFRSERNVAFGTMEKQRLNSHPVARQDEAFPGFRPDADREHSPKAAEAVRVPFAERMKDDFA